MKLLDQFLHAAAERLGNTDQERQALHKLATGLGLLMIQASSSNAKSEGNQDITSPAGVIAGEANMDAQAKALVAQLSTDMPASQWLAVASTLFQSLNYPVAANHVATLGMQLLESGKIGHSSRAAAEKQELAIRHRKLRGEGRIPRRKKR